MDPKDTATATAKDAETANYAERGQTTARDETAGAKGDDQRQTEPAPGFAAFRLWLNARLRQREGIVKVENSEKTMIVEELLHTGQLRLTYEGSFYLVPFAGEIIPELLGQII